MDSRLEATGTLIRMAKRKARGYPKRIALVVR